MNTRVNVTGVERKCKEKHKVIKSLYFSDFGGNVLQKNEVDFMVLCEGSSSVEFVLLCVWSLTAWLRLERISGGHLVQPPCSSRATYS